MTDSITCSVLADGATASSLVTQLVRSTPLKRPASAHSHPLLVMASHGHPLCLDQLPRDILHQVMLHLDDGNDWIRLSHTCRSLRTEIQVNMGDVTKPMRRHEASVPRAMRHVATQHPTPPHMTGWCFSCVSGAYDPLYKRIMDMDETARVERVVSPNHDEMFYRVLPVACVAHKPVTVVVDFALQPRIFHVMEPLPRTILPLRPRRTLKIKVDLAAPYLDRWARVRALVSYLVARCFPTHKIHVTLVGNCVKYFTDPTQAWLFPFYLYTRVHGKRIRAMRVWEFEACFEYLFELCNH